MSAQERLARIGARVDRTINRLEQRDDLPEAARVEIARLHRDADRASRIAARIFDVAADHFMDPDLAQLRSGGRDKDEPTEEDEG